MPFGLFSKLTRKERDALPAEDFGWAEKRLYPVKDQDDVDSAASLIGKVPEDKRGAVKARITAIAKRKGLSVPDAWKDEGTAEHGVPTDDGALFATPALFALGAPTAATDEVVVRPGKLFEAGDYEDQAFAITPEEMQAAAADFQPVPVDLGHGSRSHHPLEGRVGEVRSIAVADDGWSLTGTVALPKWLDDLLGDTERKVSATWDRATKRLTGLALVTDPIVADAALLGAYADFAKRHDTAHGQQALQELHNHAVRLGAVCKRPKAEMASAHEHEALQAMHDLAVDHGAHCDGAAGPVPYPMFSAPAPSAAHSTPPKGARPMSRMDEFMAWLSRDDTPAGDPSASNDPSAQMGKPATKQAAGSDDEALRERQRAQNAESELAKLRAERVQERAAAFAKQAVVVDHKILPASEDALATLYAQCAADDANPTFGAVHFGGTATTRTKLLESFVASLDGVETLLTERLKDPDVHKALFAVTAKQKTSEQGRLDNDGYARALELAGVPDAEIKTIVQGRQS